MQYDTEVSLQVVSQFHVASLFPGITAIRPVSGPGAAVELHQKHPLLKEVLPPLLQELMTLHPVHPNSHGVKHAVNVYGASQVGAEVSHIYRSETSKPRVRSFLRIKICAMTSRPSRMTRSLSTFWSGFQMFQGETARNLREHGMSTHVRNHHIIINHHTLLIIMHHHTSSLYMHSNDGTLTDNNNGGMNRHQKRNEEYTHNYCYHRIQQQIVDHYIWSITTTSIIQVGDFKYAQQFNRVQQVMQWCDQAKAAKVLCANKLRETLFAISRTALEVPVSRQDGSNSGKIWEVKSNTNLTHCFSLGAAMCPLYRMWQWFHYAIVWFEQGRITKHGFRFHICTHQFAAHVVRGARTNDRQFAT